MTYPKSPLSKLACYTTNALSRNKNNHKNKYFKSKNQIFIILAVLRQACNECGIHLRGLTKKTSQKWRTIGDTGSNSTGPAIEPQTSRTDTDILNKCSNLPVTKYFFNANLLTSRLKLTLFFHEEYTITVLRIDSFSDLATAEVSHLQHFPSSTYVVSALAPPAKQQPCPLHLHLTYFVSTTPQPLETERIIF